MSRKHKSVLKKNCLGSVICVDKNYIPMQMVRRLKAIRAVCSGRAKIVNPVTFEIRENHIVHSNEVIKIIIFEKTRRTGNKKFNTANIVASVLERDDFICGYCGDQKANTVDHIVPKCKGGGTTFSNLIACCLKCNQYKADRTPEEAGLELLYKPKTVMEVLYSKFHAAIKSNK